MNGGYAAVLSAAVDILGHGRSEFGFWRAGGTVWFLSAPAAAVSVGFCVFLHCSHYVLRCAGRRDMRGVGQVLGGSLGPRPTSSISGAPSRFAYTV
eukprot:105105-Amorphochlora_amoeboformis.AAC.1